MNVAEAHRLVADAARPYESRWTMRALLAVDRDLYLKFRDQQNLWHEALVTGTEDDIAEQTGAMCRGWQAITLRMDGTEDDAYMIGVDDAKGITVAISSQKAARERVEELYGDRVVFLDPAEVATLLGRSETIATLKGDFPGSELLA